MAKEGNTLGPITMTLFYTTDFADRLENEIMPALRAGFVVLIDRYIYSIMARAIARNEDRRWIEQVAGFALVPHATYYLRAEVDTLVSRGGAGARGVRFLGKRHGPAVRAGQVRQLHPLPGAADPGARFDGQAVRIHGDRRDQPVLKIFAELRRRISRLNLPRAARRCSRAVSRSRLRSDGDLPSAARHRGGRQDRAGDAERALTGEGREKLRRVLQRARAAGVNRPPSFQARTAARWRRRRWPRKRWVRRRDRARRGAGSKRLALRRVGRDPRAQSGRLRSAGQPRAANELHGRVPAGRNGASGGYEEGRVGTRGLRPLRGAAQGRAEVDDHAGDGGGVGREKGTDAFFASLAAPLRKQADPRRQWVPRPDPLTTQRGSSGLLS